MIRLPRIPPLLLLAVAGCLAWVLDIAMPGHQWDHPMRTPTAALLCLIGAGVAGAGVLAFRSAHTTVDPTRPELASTLVQGGIYRLTRNPMYVGFALMLLGWTVWLGAVVPLLVVPAFVLYIDRVQIMPEERALAALFGDAYREYAERVGRWL